MLKGLYSGRKIKATPGKLTRTQTGKQALNAIVKKYGKIVDSAKYMHKGKGNWVRYSIENDRKRTGKTTTSLKKWTEQPHKLDFKGKDTKGDKGKSAIKTKGKEKSKGHLIFVGDFEIYKRGNDVYVSNVQNYIDVYGYRADSRFLATKAYWDVKKNKDFLIDGFKKKSGKRFAISSLKPPAKPVRRTARTQKMKGKPVLKSTESSNNKKILADLNKRVTEYLTKTNSKNIKVVGSVSNPVIGDIKYTSVKYKVSYQNGYPAYLLRNELEEIEKKVRAGKQNILFDHDYKRTFTAPMWNFAINAFLQEYPGSDMKLAKKRALRDIVDYQINKGMEEAILKDPLSKKRKRVPSLTLNDLNRIPNKVLIGRKAKVPVIPKHKPVLKTIPKKVTNQNILSFADKDSGGRYSFYAKFSNGNYGNVAKSKDGFLSACKSRGYDIKNIKELKVMAKMKYGEEPKYLKYQLLKLTKKPVSKTNTKALPKQKKSTEISKIKKQTIGGIDRNVVESAREDWNNQCKLFMSSKIPFKDKTAKACLERHKRLGY